MSTKIYNAYKFDGTMEELFHELVEVRKKCYDQFIEDIDKWASEKGKKGHISLVQEIEKEMKLKMNTPMNFKSSIMVYLHKGDIYIQLFGVKNEYMNKRFTDFHFQNQCLDFEEEEDIEEYMAREKVWDKILLWHKVPSECGFMFPIVEEDSVFSLAYDYFIKKRKT